MARVIAAFILAAFCLASSVQSTPFHKCDDGPPPQSLRIHGCDEMPCLLKKGTNQTTEWDFVIQSDSEKLKPTAKAKLFGGIVVDYPLPEHAQDGCKALTNAECPLDEGEEVSYVLEMPIHKSYPNINLNIKIALLNEREEVQMCFSVDAKVVS